MEPQTITLPIPEWAPEDSTVLPMFNVTTNTSRPEHYLEFIEDPGEDNLDTD